MENRTSSKESVPCTRALLSLLFSGTACDDCRALLVAVVLSRMDESSDALSDPSTSNAASGCF